MHVRFWGTRGSIPTPGHRTAVFGGNTSCVELRTKDGTTLVLDCGTGIRVLGLDMLRRPGPHRIHLLIGHTHWDHIQGFPFFTPAFLPGTELNIYGSVAFQRSLEDSLSGQMQYSYFPVKLQDLASRIHYAELEEGFFRIGEILVETQYLNHTAPTIAYRITCDGATVAYVTDHEPFWNSTGPVFHHPGDQRHIDFLRGADLVIHDAQYTSEEYRTKVGWGHSPADYVTGVGVAAGATRLALFHHDPTHDDDAIKVIEDTQRARAKAAGSSLAVFAAAEGTEFEVIGKGWEKPIIGVSALDRRPIAGGRVMVVTPHDADISAMEQVLPDDGLVLTAVPDGHTALETCKSVLPDLVILDGKLTDGAGSSFIQPLRSLLGRSDLPTIILTEGRDGTQTPDSAESIATDYLAKPFSPPMLRTRVRAWLARTLSPAAQPETVVSVSRQETSTADVRKNTGEAVKTSRAKQATDPLTGLPGHHAFHELYRRLTAAAKGKGTGVLLLLVDVSHLKDINDHFGYSVGDDVLRTVADALIESSRTTDIVARYGADEFTVLLIEAAAKDVDVITKRVQQKLLELAVYRNLPLTVDCRIGYAASEDPPDSADELLRIADVQMQGNGSGAAK
jgi:diguanylate cyclase (GGDEF)-like protein